MLRGWCTRRFLRRKPRKLRRAPLLRPPFHEQINPAIGDRSEPEALVEPERGIEALDVDTQPACPPVARSAKGELTQRINRPSICASD
jgi:hypothetical protein